MALCSQSSAEFIQGAFCPTIAVTCSEDADRVCMRNKLSFVEMARPFCQLTTEAHIRDPTGVTHTVKNWKLRLLEMAAPHPPQHVINKLLNEVVSRTQPVKSDSSSYSPDFQSTASTPWFEAYRDCLFQLLKPSDHEFIRHFLACVFVVSSHHPDPMNAFATMTSQQLDQQQSSHNSHIKWFSTGVFKYYVLLHDVTEGVESKADAVYQSMKSVYGFHACHLLHINSVNPTVSNVMPNLPDPWSQFIIPASEDTMDWDDDEVDGSIELAEEDPENCAVDENFDPEAAVEESEEQKRRSGSGSILIGPLTFEDEPEPEQEIIENAVPAKSNANLSNYHDKKHLAGHYRYFSSRKFTSGMRIQTGQRTHGLCLSLSDQDRVKIFIHELAFRGLLPFMEKMMRSLNDQITARKGIHRSIFTATKKWFGGGKPAGLASGLVPGIIYTNDSPELYLRKLGDLAFLVQNYELAYTCYHAAKRDFNGEHAWFYFAGALEMAASSAFLAGLQRPYPSHYMETAISTYLTACRQHMFAVRATLLSTEALKAKNMTLDAAMQFMRMTGEESDLLCALLLEQSAHCFLHCSPLMVRKYAFNMILAGHRYSKSAQRKHALRCYRQALSIYYGKSWTLAEDHINFTLGRQSFNLRQLDEAQLSFKQLLIYESRQPPQQQAAYLREFLFVFKQLVETKEKEKDKTKEEGLPYLPLPMLDSNATRAILSYRKDLHETLDTPITLSDRSEAKQDPFGVSLFSDKEPNTTKASGNESKVIGLCSFDEKFDSNQARRWKKLEEEVYKSVNVTPVPSLFRPHVNCLSSRTNNSTRPLCVVKETVAVEVKFYNPLRIPLNLTNLMLLWKFTPSTGNHESAVSNEFADCEDLVQTELISNFGINGCDKKTARLTVTPCCTGQLHITGIKYSLSSIAIGGPVEDSFISTEPNPAVSAVSMLGRLDLNVRGPRLNTTKVEKTSVVHGEDYRLNMEVVPSMPLLEVHFHEFPKSLLCGELVRTTAVFSNLGQCTLRRLFIASTTPEFFTIGTANKDTTDNSVYQTIVSTNETSVQHVSPVTEVRRVSEVPIPGGSIPPGESVKLPIWIRGCEEVDSQSKEVLFYYESKQQNAKMSYRVLQHAFAVESASSLVVRATARRSKHGGKKDSCDEKDQLIIALDVENLVQGQNVSRLGELEIVQVSCVSRKWRLLPLSHHKKDGVIQVRPGETIVTQFKATKFSDKPTDVLGFSHVPFTDNVINSSVTPAVDFFFRSRAWKEMMNGWNSRAESATVNTTTVDVGLVVFWKSSFIDEHFLKKTVMGQSHVSISTLAESVSAVKPVPPPDESSSPLGSSPSAVDSRELLVKYSLMHQSRIRQDFKRKSRIVSVPVELILYNCCDKSVDIFVERVSSDLPVSVSRQQTEEPNTAVLEVETDSGHRPATTSFIFVGQTSKRLLLEPNATTSLQFNAMISLPGVYNLNQLRMYAEVQRDRDLDFDLNLMTLQKRSPPSFIVIEDTSSSSEVTTDKPNYLVDLDAT